MNATKRTISIFCCFFYSSSRFVLVFIWRKSCVTQNLFVWMLLVAVSRDETWQPTFAVCRGFTNRSKSIFRHISESSTIWYFYYKETRAGSLAALLFCHTVILFFCHSVCLLGYTPPPLSHVLPRFLLVLLKCKSLIFPKIYF